MKKTLKQLLEEARMTELSASEKSHILDALKTMIDPPAHGYVRNVSDSRQHLRRSMVKSTNLIFKPMPIFIAILIALGGGTSFAAQAALPGDALYDVKVNVNEEVRGWFSLSDEARAQWETVLANRRLAEAEELAAESKLDAETRAKIEAKFEDHADKVEKRIEKLAEVDAKAAADIAARLETSLKAHDRILLNIGTSKDGDVEVQIKSLSAKVKAEVRDASNDRVKNENEVKAGANVQAAAEGRLKAAENKVAEVSKYIANNKDKLGAEATVQAEARLKVASDLIVQGKAQLEAKAYSQAFTLFGQAHAKAQEAKLLIEAKVRFENGSEASPSPSASPSPTVSPSPSPSASAQAEVNSDRGQSSGKIRIDLRF